MTTLLQNFNKSQPKDIDVETRQPAGTAHLPEEQAYKRLAYGTGKTPTSSITSRSQGSASHHRAAPQRALSSPTHADFEPRGPSTPGKRLFDPSEASSPQHSATNLNVLSRPVHRSRRSHSQNVPPTSMQRPSSSYAPGTLTARETQAKQPSSLGVDSNILSQPETRPISQKQLVAEVKGIYAGLVMVEGKCIQVDLKQAQLARDAQPGTQPKLNNEQYQALIALHRTLLREHHDFFLASQHPSATPAVKRLALNYAMPARLWRHGIHSFLELLRNRLPASLEYMLAFIYLAYSMMTLLLETVPAFEDTWIECLGDLGRYRMAIEDDNIRDKEVWTQVARQWYLKCANRSPTTGRLYHHLAILARPEALPQLLYYGKSLAVPIPFTAARESIMTLFEPVLDPKSSRRRFSPVISAFVRSHAIIFTGQSLETFDETMEDFISRLDSHIARITKKYLEQGYFLAISNCMALLGYGSEENPLNALVKSQGSQIQDRDVLMGGTSLDENSKATVTFKNALHLFNKTLQVHLQRIGDTNVLSFLHVTLVFIRYMSNIPRVIDILDLNWASLVTMLNSILAIHKPSSYTVIEGSQLPKPDPIGRRNSTELQQPDIAGNHSDASPSTDEFRPFPEEWAMQGLGWTADYFPPGWFHNPNVESEKHYLEAESMRTEHRPERVLWLGIQIARIGGAIAYDAATHTFTLPGVPAAAAARADEAEAASGRGAVVAEGTGEGRRAGSECTTETLGTEVEVEMSDAEMGECCDAVAAGGSGSFSRLAKDGGPDF